MYNHSWQGGGRQTWPGALFLLCSGAWASSSQTDHPHAWWWDCQVLLGQTSLTLTEDCTVGQFFEVWFLKVQRGEKAEDTDTTPKDFEGKQRPLNLTQQSPPEPPGAEHAFKWIDSTPKLPDQLAHYKLYYFQCLSFFIDTQGISKWSWWIYLC